MRHEDGSEVLLTFALPLDARLVAELCGGIADAAARAGWTDVALLGDGTNRVVAWRMRPGEFDA